MACHGSITQAALLDRWLRLQMHVRCALSPASPCGIRVFVLAGQHLARHGLMATDEVNLRTLRTLLQAALDSALPTAWRQSCLEQTPLPLARATSLLSRRDPTTLAGIVAALDLAQHKLTDA